MRDSTMWPGGSRRVSTPSASLLPLQRRRARMSSFIFDRSVSMSARVGGSLAKAVSMVATALALLLVPAMAADKSAAVISPGGPCAPGGPCDPSLPGGPCGPGGPGGPPGSPGGPDGPDGPSGPGGPMGPAGPGGPDAPSLPGSPCGPAGPCAPEAPSFPGGPWGPGGPPGSPGGPCGPGGPAGMASISALSAFNCARISADEFGEFATGLVGSYMASWLSVMGKLQRRVPPLESLLRARLAHEPKAVASNL